MTATSTESVTKRLSCRYNFIWFFIILTFLYLTPFFTHTSAAAPADFLFINQVRGNECCAKGGLDFLRRQLDAFIQSKVPAYFILRYDALIDQEYVTLLKSTTKRYSDLIRLGLMIEITPRLAQDATGNYSGDPNRWYEAQNAFTIGYAKGHSKKIVDTLFEQFYTLFGYYPTVTSAWMIDTETLNYLYDRYGVKIHQITREQWGTDSYTLYGGPPHYPYPPSKNWLIVPDYQTKRNLLIVRQTVADPLFNFGDQTNTFTSQPNDYLAGGKPFLYFTSLVNQAINQPHQKGFILLGLENSMNEESQNEFTKQIEYVAGLMQASRVASPSIEEVIESWNNNKFSVYSGRDLTIGTKTNAYWITTPLYRVRILERENAVLITDLRLYNNEYKDPYSYAQAQKHGFWIVPYLVDGSHLLSRVVQKTTIFQKLFEPPPQEIINSRTQDFHNEKLSAINLPDRKTDTSITIDKNEKSISLSYRSQKNKTVTLVFENDRIVFSGFGKNDIRYPFDNPLDPISLSQKSDGFDLSWPFEKGNALTASFSCREKEQRCVMVFDTKPALFARLRDAFYPFLFPEPSQKRKSQSRVRVYIHNPFAIAGRNPVRAIVSLTDRYGLPVGAEAKDVAAAATPNTIDIRKIEPSHNRSAVYVDFYNNQPLATSLEIRPNNTTTFKQTVYFAPNCKDMVQYCFAHPLQGLWYLAAVAGNKLRGE